MRAQAIATPSRTRHARPRLLPLLQAWWMRRKTRRALERLPDHLLRDIGLDPLTARREAAKPFWRA